MLDSQLLCPDCQTQHVEGVAEGMSYVLRCGACGDAILATSLIAILKPDSDRIIEARLDPRIEDRPAAAATIEKLWGLPVAEVLARDPLFRGPTRTVRDMILAVAQAGVPLVLHWPSSS
ncbi:MAG: hypothetical protein HOW73_22655 [Polyangiaceae bacterium]|nr:hypothetical protein [Polyangiaceae bacterium]